MMNFENNNDVDELTNRLNESKEAKLRFNKFEKAFKWTYYLCMALYLGYEIGYKMLYNSIRLVLYNDEFYESKNLNQMKFLYDMVMNQKE